MAEETFTNPNRWIATAGIAHFHLISIYFLMGTLKHYGKPNEFEEIHSKHMRPL